MFNTMRAEGARRVGLDGGTRWGWWVALGVLLVIAGLFANALWVLGLFLAIDLLFAGVAYVAFGLTERAASAVR